MNGFCISPALAIVFFGFLSLSALADNGFSNYPPSQNPSFRLIESTTDYAVIAFEPPLDEANLSERVSENVFIGVPPSSVHEIELLEWKYRYIQGNETVAWVSGSIHSASVDFREIKKQLDPAITAERSQFQELDILKITFQFPQNADVEDSTQTYTRDKVIADQLIYKVSWKERGFFKPAPQSSTNAGYAKLFSNLVLNASDALKLRSKRHLNETEKNHGFHAIAAGYIENGSIVNKLNDLDSMDFRRDAVRVLVRKNGVTAVRPTDLDREGIDPSLVKLDWAQVWHKGTEVNSSIYDHNADTVFNEGDAIYFYGQESGSPFTNDSPYYLTWGVISSPPKRAVPIEPNAYQVKQPVHTADLLVSDNRVLGMESVNNAKWFYAQLDDQNNLFPVHLPGLHDAGDVEITLSWMNKNKINTGIMVNVGNATQSFFLDVDAVTETVFRVAASEYLQSPTVHILMHQKPPAFKTEEGSTKKTVIPRLFLDSIHFRYPKLSAPDDSPMVLYPDSLSTVQLQSSTETLITAWVVHNNEITHLIQPEQPVPEIALPNVPRDKVEIYQRGTEQGPFTVDKDFPSTLHRADQGFDYVIIAYRTLIDEARRLAQLRADEGFHVLLTDVQDIYDEFNDGYPGYDAIKRFLRYAQSEWNGLSPEFVVLVGECNWDHRDYEGQFVLDQIPTYTPVDDPQNFASDEWYAYLWSEEDHVFSDVIIGRISVSNPDDLKQYIDKVYTYHNDTPVGLWKGRNLFISDDNFWMHSYTTAQTSITEKLSPAFVNQNIFPHETSPYLYERFHNFPDETIRREYSNKKISSEATLAVLEAMNQSALIAQYYGHGGAQLWSHERLFYGTDRETSNVLELKPTNKFPFILNWSCLTGYLNINIPPFHVCLAEEFVRHGDRGAIAVWAPSENGHTDQHELMSHFVVRSLIQDGLTRLGEAATYTKTEYLLTRNGANDYKLMEQYILFGDPGIELAVPAETLELTNTPVSLVPNHENEISLQVKSDTVINGNAVVSFAYKGENIYESNALPVSNGVIEHKWNQSLPESKADNAIVRIYMWDEANNKDAWGGIRIPIVNPVVSIGNGVVNLDHNPHAVSVEIKNQSNFPISGLECAFQVGSLSETVKIETIGAKSSQSVVWSGLLPDDVHFVYAEIANPERIPIQLENNTKKIAVEVPKEQSDRMAPLLGLITYSPEEVVKQNITRLQIPFRNLSHDKTLYATTTVDGPGSATLPKQISLTPQQERQLVYSITPPETGVQNYVLTIDTGDQKEEITIPVDVKEKPDLALAEGGVIITPENPVIGKTVTLKTNVYNMGESTALNVSVTAYDGDPMNNKKLTSFRNTGSDTINEIAPGESKEIEILWDPEAYEGVGVHEIHLVVDSFNRIDELSEENNNSAFTLTLYDLPDLYVNPWSDHQIKINTANNRIPVWSEPMQLTARMRNLGDSDAEYARLTFYYNQKEITRFIDHLQPQGAAETQVDIPLLSAKHTLTVHADKYNLLGEKNEVTEEDNNISKERRLYVQLQMPEAKILDNRRFYEITAETQFDAGTGDYYVYDPIHKGISITPMPEKVQMHLNPAYVENPENFDLQVPNTLWEWNIKYNVFSTPVNSDAELRFRVPAINGTFDVYAQLYSNNPDKSAPDSIRFKVLGEVEYQLFEYAENDDPKSFHKIGTYTIKDDYFVIEFKAVPGGYSTNVGDLMFIHSTQDTQPVSAGYLSPYFPAAGASGVTEMEWDAHIPEGAEINIKPRWVVKNPDHSLKFLPWARTVPGSEKKMKVMGSGDYLQYYVEFKKPVELPESPVLSNLKISIPGKDG